MKRTINDITGNGEQSLDEVLMESRLDFGAWVRKVMGGQYKWFHREWFNAFHNKERSAIVAPRGHGKSFILGVAYPLWYTFFNEGKKFMMVSPTQNTSKRLLRELKERIYNNELLQQLKPENRNKEWTKSYIQTSTNCDIFSQTYSDNARGEHIDRLIGDEAAYFDDKDIFKTVFTPMVNKADGHICLISTPKSNSDLVMEMKENERYTEPNGFSKVYRAVDEDTGEPLWPEEFDEEKLEEIRKEQGKLKFEREYLCNPVASGTPAFPLDKINDALLRGEDVRLYKSPSQIEDDDERESMGFYIGVDIGLSDAYEAGWTVFIVVEKFRNGDVVLRDVWRSKGLTQPAVENKLRSYSSTWNPRMIYMDASTFGKNYVESLKGELPVRGVSFTRDNRMDMLITLGKYFDEENLILPSDKEDVQTQKQVEQLEKELAAMYITETDRTGQQTMDTNATWDDMVMALALSVYGADKQKQVLESW